MIKYVLNSGGVSGKPELSRKFFTEIVEGLGNTPRVLICLFAAQRENWDKKFAIDILSIPALMPNNVKPSLELAYPDIFEKQINETDAIYIHGGDDHLVQYWLRKYDLLNLFKDKVVGTNSASSNAMAESFWTCDWRMCMKGFGILPIKFIAHYKSSFGSEDSRGPIDWIKSHDELSKFGNTSLPIHALEEGHYIVVKQ